MSMMENAMSNEIGEHLLALLAQLDDDARRAEIALQTDDWSDPEDYGRLQLMANLGRELRAARAADQLTG
jgi:hypothetical protein